MSSLIEIIENIIKVLVFPGIAFASIAGLLLAGFDRKVLARMQRRVGPPILQPTYDFLKLMGKETIVPQAANKKAFMAAPIIGFAGLIVMLLFIPIGGYSAFSFKADLLVILYLLTIPAVALIVAGSASGSPYAGIGISREMVTMMAYELPLIIVLLAVAKLTGGENETGLQFSLQGINAWQNANGPIILHLSMIPAALAILLIIPAEVGTQPFDVAEAETEICEGPLVEYSGAPLGMFKLNTAIKMFVMTSLFVVFFLGGITNKICTGVIINIGAASIAWLDVLIRVIIHLIICIVLTLISMTTLHAVCARFKIEHLFKFYWTAVTALAAISLILVWIGL